MANKTIPELLEVASPNSTDPLIIHNGGLAKKIQLQNILPEVSDTSTIDLTINKPTRTISGEVKTGSITNTKLADVPSFSIKGRKEIDSGSVQDLTLLEVQGLLNTTNIVTDTEVRSLTGNWEDTYTTVRDFSGSWGPGSVVDTEVRSLTSNWEDAYTTVTNTSGSWNNTFNTTNSNTVNLAWNNSTRTLSADVVGSSLTTVLSSSLSSSLVVAKAWVNFNGTTNPPTIRSSYNVSSVTKNGTGDFRINFATPMIDTNYSVSINVRSFSVLTNSANDARSFSLNYFEINAIENGNPFDSNLITAQVFGN